MSHQKIERVTGFSLAEVMLAIGLLSIALLALIGQSTLLARTNQKIDDSSVAYDVAKSVFDRVNREIVRNQPPNRNEDAWIANSSTQRFLFGTETVGFTEYSWELYVTDVANSATGATVGTGPTGAENEGTRLKQFYIKVEWWGGESEEGRGQSGKLRVETTRLVKVTRAS